MSGNTSATGRPSVVPKAVFIVVLMIVFLFIFVNAALVTYILPKSYMSTARILLEPATNNVAGTDRQLVSSPEMITAIEVIQSELILGKVIDLLNLNVEWGKKYGGGVPLKTIETMEILKKHMDLRPVRNTMVLEVRIFDEDPLEASKIANAVVEAYRGHLAEEAKPLGMEILDTAKPGEEPVRPNVPLNLAVGAFIGIVMGSLVGGGAAWVTSLIVRGLKKDAV